VVHAVIEGGHAVVPIPGPSAVLAALVASGLPAERFAYLGFVPRRGPDRRALLERVARSEETVVLFESPERLVRLLEDLASACGKERRVAVARELTKLHEAVVRGTLAEAYRYYEGSTPRGEISVVVDARPRESAATQSDLEAARALARSLLEGGASPSGVAREVSRQLRLPRNLAYEIVQEAKDG
jgi:16S rRNA (cytidine1402-2'-O)-methyltransferase